MRQKIVRLTLVAGVLVLALLLLLATCGAGDSQDRKGADKPAKPVPTPTGPGPATQLTVPPAYTTQGGWELVNTSPDYAISRTTGRLGYLLRVADNQYRLETIDSETGKAGWKGENWRPPASKHSPKLLLVTKNDVEYFVTWTYGKVGVNALTPADTIISLDVYDVKDGARRRIEVPWSSAPSVIASGPDILISDGRTTSVVVDPATGQISKIAPSALKYPKDCPSCKQLTEVFGLTKKGLLVSGAREFWVQGGWFSRNVAPKNTDRTSGIPTTVAPGWVLAKWQLAKGQEPAKTHDLWAVHDAETGKPVATVECNKVAIKPGQYPQAVMSPSGGYLVAGNLAFDLTAKKGFCLEAPDGSKRLTLASVTDEGIAYGATNVRNATDALNGGGRPVAVEVVTGTPEGLPSNVRLPGEEAEAGVGVFRWTDELDRLHLLGYPRAPH
ncbi:hypothetical protein [Streptomyces sp. NBC_01320]|uniref:hypothetical protein n=1 Tax=Streptomyces sp. NBC_01320 TaxID=2903824 RepID=UPI002E14A65A|nr:hypothetical protein OG395_36225 [Streptomyces sp. NBC_01320]